jgi:hypothetical protein
MHAAFACKPWPLYSASTQSAFTASIQSNSTDAPRRQKSNPTQDTGTGAESVRFDCFTISSRPVIQRLRQSASCLVVDFDANATPLAARSDQKNSDCVSSRAEYFISHPHKHRSHATRSGLLEAADRSAATTMARTATRTARATEDAMTRTLGMTLLRAGPAWHRPSPRRARSPLS